MAGAPGALSGSAAEGKPVATNAPEQGVKTNPLPGSVEMPGGLDATGIQAAGALKLQFGTTLAGDQETITEVAGRNKYQQELLIPKEYERNAIERGREINEGIAQSGMAAGNHARSVANFLSRRQGLQLSAQERINRAERNAQEGRNKAQQALGGITLASNQRKELAAIKNPTLSPEAPAAPATGAAAGYPGATAAVKAAFPGGAAEKNAYYRAIREGKPYGVVNPGGTAQRAKGGPVQAGHPYLVGERGPELMVPKTSGRVVRNAAIRKAMKR